MQVRKPLEPTIKPQSQWLGFLIVMVACVAAPIFTVSAQTTQPLVAIHDSELTRALESQTATGSTPVGTGATGYQWWTPDWHYFVMPESMEEALRSDGTAFTVVGDSNITAGALLTNGVPAYPIVITLASEAMSDDEIAPLTNYVAAGGFLFIGGSAFTRQADGSSRGDFALAWQMGVHMVVPALTNWTTNSTFSRQFNQRIVSHIPDGPLTWRMPSSSEEINWGISPTHIFLAPHDLWQVQVSDATLVAQGNNFPYITVKQYGKGYIIYDAAFNPLVGNGGFAPGMYAYVIVRKAVEWAFESARLPVPKLSPWPYQYDAAFTIRHDLEDFSNEVAHIDLSAQFEFTNGVKGDYYFCTGTLRQDMAGKYDTNAIVLSLQDAMANYGATIGPHNGGLQNPNNTNLVESDYDFWHWGPDEALDTTPSNYPSGFAYAAASLSNSFTDIESWLPGLMTTNLRVWAAPNFNATRENSYKIQDQLGVKIAGDQKISPFPHWTLSTQTSGLRYGFLSEPVSDWFVGGLVAQSLEPWHPPGVHTTNTLHAAVDYYYSLGALINVYSHTLSTGEGDAGQLVPEYITYSMNTNLHPRLWSANAVGVYQWWLQRSNAQVSVSSVITNGNQCSTTFVVGGASDANTAVEMVLPGAGTVYDLQVNTNGAAAAGDSYRTTGQTLKVMVGTSVTNAVVTYTLGPGAQGDNYSVNENTTLTNAAPGVLANDNAGLGSTNLTAQLVSDVNNGVLNLNSDGSFTYTPALNFAGTDTFTYEAFDGQTNSSPATVTITVISTNLAPVATNDSYVFQLNKALTIPAPGVLANDSDPDGDSLTAVLVAGPTNGTLTLNGDGSFIYVPATNFSGVDSFTYQASDGQTNSAIATVTLSDPVEGVLFSDDFTRTNGLLAPWLTYSNNWVATNGFIQTGINPGASYSFAYLTNSWTNYSVQGSVRFSTTSAFGGGIGGCLNPLNGAHYAAWIYPEGSPVGSAMMNIVKFDNWSTWGYSNVALEPIATVMNLPGGVGTNWHTVKLAFSTNQIAAYYDGVEVVSVTDNQGPYLSGGVTADMWTDFVPYIFSVDNVVVSTLVADDNYSTEVFSNLTVAAPGVLANDTEVYGTNLQAQLVSSPANGAVTLNADGSFTYTPTFGFFGSDSFTYAAIDGQTNLGIATVNITVNGVHNGPSLPSQSDLTIGELTAITVTNTAVDADFPTWNLTYSLVSPPDGAAIDTNGVITWTPSYAQTPSTNVFTTVVSDNAPLQKSATNSFTVIVDEVNMAPFLQPQTNWTINELTLLTITNTATEKNPHAVITGFSLFNPLSGMNIDSNGVFTWTPSQDQSPSTNTVTVVVANSDPLDPINPVLTASNSFTVIVTEINQAPVIASVGSQVVNELALLTVTNAITEPNIHAVTATVALINPLAGMNIDSNGVFTWTPGQNQSSSTNTVTVVVTNNDSFDLVNPALSATNSFTVVVREVNVAPQLPVISAQTVNEQSLLTVTNTAVEPNIHAVTTGYAIASPLPGMNISSNGIFTWTPSQSQSPGTNLVTVVVNNFDSLDTINPVLMATNSFTVVVKEVNVAPTLPAIPVQTVNELVPLTVTNTATESNVHAAITGYGLISPLPGMNISSNGIFTWTPSQSQSPGTNLVTVVVTNNDAFDLVNPVLTATNIFTVIVTEVNVAPVLASAGAQTVNELTLLTVTNMATEPNIHATTTGFGLISPLAGMNINSNGIFTWTPSQNQSPGTNTVTVVVTNHDGFDLVNPTLTATNTFTVVVKEINVAPSLPAIGTQIINEQVQLTVTDTATETNIHAITTGYGIVSPLTGMGIDTNGIFTWTPAQNQSPSTNLVTVVVTNHDAFDLVNPILTATNSFTVIVREVNVAPVVAPISPQTVNELTLLTVTNAATEPNIHAVITGFGLANPLPGMNVDSNGAFTWTPSQTQSPGTNLVNVVVTNFDSLDPVNPVLMTTNTFTVMVREVNVAPVLATNNTQTVNELTSLVVTNTATESNIHATIAGFGLISALPGMNINSNGIFSWTPSQTQSPSTNLITVVVTNNDPFDLVNPKLTATNSFTVIVKEVNVAPQFPNISTQFANEQSLLTVPCTVTESNIHAATVGYALINPLAGMNIDTNGIFTWTPAQNQSPSTNQVIVVAINNDPFDQVNPELTAATMFTVVVKEVNIAPVISLVSTQTLNELTLLTVTNTATEPNIHAVTTGFGLANPLPGMAINSNGVFTWTPSQTQSPGTNLVKVVATNFDSLDQVNPVLTATNSFTVIVKEVNQPPTLPVIGTQTVNEQVQLTVNDAATETNIHSVTTSYTLVGPVAGMSISSNGVFTWTPSQSQSPGTNTVTVVAANSNAFDALNPVLTATNSFTVIVKEINVAPVLPVIGTQTVNEQTLLTVTNTATEPNVHATTAGYTLIAPLPGMNISSNGIFTWTPSQNQSPGTNLVTTVVSNSDNLDPVNPALFATNTFSVVVREVNIAPVLPVIGAQTVNEQTLLTVTNAASEPNIHAVTTGYGLISPLPGMNITSNGVFTWTPSQNQSPGTNTITVVATNSDSFDLINPTLTTTNSFTVVVKEINVAPVSPVIGTQTVNEQTLLTVTNAATEPNVHAVTTGYGLVSPLAGMNITSNGVFTWTPSQSQSPGTNTVTVVVTNSDSFDLVNPTLTATNSFTVIVKEINVAPVLPVIGAQTVNEQTLLTVTNTASEPNTHAVTTSYTLVAPLPGMNINSNGIFTWAPTQSQSPGTNLVTTVVSNSDSFDTVNPTLSATNTFTVVVREVNIAPVLPVVGTQSVNEQTLLTVTNAATEPNIHAVTTGYGLVGPLAGMNITSNGVFTWTPSQSQSPSTNTVTVVVTNSDTFDSANPTLTATNSFTVIVKEVNVAPVLPVIGPQGIGEKLLLTVTNTATEPNIHAVTTGYAIVSPLTGMSIDTNGIFTWTPHQSQSPSTNVVTIIATNSNTFDTVNPTLTATNSFTVVVQEINVAPTLPLVGAQTVNEQILLTVTNTAAETNIHSVTTGYTLIGSLPGMNIDTNGIFTWTPSQNQSPSTNTVTVVAANSNAFDTVNPVLASTNSFTVIVKEVNIAPVLSTIGTQTVNEQTLLTVTNAATEPNIHAVTTGYGLISPLAGMNINSNGVFSWTPSQNQSPSTNTVTVVVTNSDIFDLVNPALTATSSFTVIVKEVNIAPVLPAIGTQTLAAGNVLTVTNAATEPNIHAATTGYGLVNPPAGATISAGGLITWTPSAPGTNTITTVVTNSDSFDLVNPMLTATNSFTVVVTSSTTNAQPPVIQSIASTNGIITITWSSVVGRTYGVQYKGNFAATNWQALGTNIVATNIVTSTTDTNNNGQRFYRVVMLPAPSNQPPVLPAQGNYSVHALGTLVVTNTASYPGGTNSLVYSITNPPSGLAIDTNGVITWTPALVQAPSTNMITTVVTVSGQSSLSATNSFTVVVAGPVTLQAVNIAGTNAVVSWTSLASHNYRLQYKVNITDTNWINLSPDVQAIGATVSVTNVLGSDPQRFYRVQLLP